MITGIDVLNAYVPVPSESFAIKLGFPELSERP